MRTMIAVTFPILALVAAAGAGGADPKRTEFTLPNGLRVRMVPASDDKDVVVILGLPAGFRAEPAGKPHVAHVAEHLVVFGNRPGSDEAKAVERWFAEGRANGETLLPLVYFDLRVRPGELARALRLQASRLEGPVFTRETLDREVPRTLAEVENVDRLDEGYTSKFAAIAFIQAALHGRADMPLRAKTRELTVDDVRDFWSRSARPDRAILCVAGAFDPADARNEIEAAFGTIPMPASSPAPTGGALKPGHIAATWDLRARHLLIAWPAPPASDPDHPTLTVASVLLMQRLFGDPEIAALSKYPAVGNDADGYFLVNAYVRPGADPGALEAKILDRVRGLSQRGMGILLEVGQARTALGQMLGAVDVEAIPLPKGVSRSYARTNVELQRMIRELCWGDPASYKARIDAVDAGAVRDVVARRLDPAKATIVLLGPGR